jgi:glycine cleavage system aminomethyltransferase T
MRGVGLADRSDVGVIAVTRRPARLSELVKPLTGAALEVGGVVAAPAAWWCLDTPGRLLAITEQAAHERLLATLQAPAWRLHGVDADDLSDETAVLALVGIHATDVLRDLGALGRGGDPRMVPPFTRVSVDGVQAGVLLQSDRRALLLARTDNAEQLWCAVRTAGGPYGLNLVGTDAARHFAVHERMVATQTSGVGLG